MPKIGIITNDAKQTFQKAVITGIQQYAISRDYEVVIDSIERAPRRFETLRLPIDELSGIIVIANVLETDTLRALQQLGKPISLISHQVAGLAIPAVISNNRDGIQYLVDYLVTRCNRREIVFIRGDMGQFDGIQRDLIFRQSMLRHNLMPRAEFLLRGDFSPTRAAESLDALISAGGVFDAVLAADYLMGVAILKVLKQHKLAVPRDVCVVGFGDGQEAEQAGLTTAGLDIVEVGRRAERQLFAQIDGLQIQGVTWLDTALIRRQSCKEV
jgi:DNA-binding LacI/PurR family transcriptional regulator